MNCVTECMLRATSIGVGNVVVNMNTTSFNLMWTTNMAYNSSYFIPLSANSGKLMNISTNEVFVNLILQINLSYCVDIYYEVKEQENALNFFKFCCMLIIILVFKETLQEKKQKTLIINNASVYNCSSK